MDLVRHAVAGARACPGGWRHLSGKTLALVGIAACLTLGACGSPPALTDTQPSDQAVARAVLDAVAREDRDALMRLALTKEEFDEVVWPTLPASRPEVGMPRDYLWQDTFSKSRAYLATTLNELGSRRFELLRVEFEGPTTDNGVYSLSRKTRLVVRDSAGRESTIRVFGSIIRQHGRSKVYSYIVD